MSDPAPSTPRSLTVVSAVVAFLAFALATVAGFGVIDIKHIPLTLAVLAILHGAQTFLPALWGRAPVPVVEPPKIADAVAKVGVFLFVLALTGCERPSGDPGEIACVGALLAAALAVVIGIYLCGRREGAFALVFLLATAAHANPIAPGVALQPGPEEIAVEATRPQQAPPQPMVYAANRAPMVRAPLLAQLAAAPALQNANNVQPDVNNVQQNVNSPPAAALNPNIPICPPPAPAPPTTLGKVEKWLYVAGAVIALASVTAEKLDAIVSGRASATP